MQPVDFIYFAEVNIRGWNEKVAETIRIVSEITFLATYTYIYIIVQSGSSNGSHKFIVSSTL